MSSSEEENFNLDVSGSDSESDDYAPAPKKKVAPKPKATTKPAAKPKQTAPKKKVLSSKAANASDSDDDVENDAPDSIPFVAATNGKKKTASETYQKVRAYSVS